MNHEFILVDLNEMPNSISYELKDGHERSILDDEIVVNNPLFLRGFETFKISFKNRSEGLDYWGNTIIPTSSIKQFLRQIEDVKISITGKMFLNQLNDLELLLKKALLENKYIIHFGI